MLFLIDTVDTASYVDNNTLCNIEKKQYEVEKKNRNILVKNTWMIPWKRHESNSRVSFLSGVDITTKLSLTGCSIENSNYKQLLERKLNFKEYFTSLCNKARKKV